MKTALNKEEICAGAEKFLQNAANLRATALQCAAHGQHGPAVTLACIRVEEIAKVHLILAQLDNPDWPAFWKAFRNHEEKWVAHTVTNLNQQKGMSPQEVEVAVRKQIKSVAQFKNSGVYVNYTNSKGWVAPADMPMESQVPHVLTLGDLSEQKAKEAMVRCCGAQPNKSLNPTSEPLRGSDSLRPSGSGAG